MFLIANDAQPNQWGNSPSYGIFHGGTAPQLLPDNHPLLKYVLPAECSCPCSCRHSLGLFGSWQQHLGGCHAASHLLACSECLCMLWGAVRAHASVPAAGAPPGASVCPCWLAVCCAGQSMHPPSPQPHAACARRQHCRGRPQGERVGILYGLLRLPVRPSLMSLACGRVCLPALLAARAPGSMAEHVRLRAATP